jgi:hypothetical protein
MAVAYDLFLAKGSNKLFPSLPLTSLPFQSSSECDTGFLNLTIV